MGSGVKRIGLSCAIGGILLAGASHAAVVTTSYAKNALGPVAIPLFDPALGKLLSVYAEASYTSWLPYTSYLAPVGYDHAVAGTATLGGMAFAINGASQAQWSGSSGVFTVSANGTATWTSAADIALFSGASGNLVGYAGASAAAPGTPMSGNYVPSVNYKVSYTYDNTPAVPEPATWAMMVGGFVMMGLALRASRRKPVATETSEA